MDKIKISGLFGIIASALTICSCEDVIELDLKNSEPKLVVESFITDSDQPLTVKLSKSTGFYSQSELPTVSGALVILSDNNQITDTLIESGKGFIAAQR